LKGKLFSLIRRRTSVSALFKEAWIKLVLLNRFWKTFWSRASANVRFRLPKAHQWSPKRRSINPSNPNPNRSIKHRQPHNLQLRRNTHRPQ